MRESEAWLLFKAGGRWPADILQSLTRFSFRGSSSESLKLTDTCSIPTSVVYSGSVLRRTFTCRLNTCPTVFILPSADCDKDTHEEKASTETHLRLHSADVKPVGADVPGLEDEQLEVVVALDAKAEERVVLNEVQQADVIQGRE
jgi:hypothetical protein